MLDYLDKLIENFRQRTGDYPIKILISDLAREKLFSELELEPTLNNSWFDKKDNYRGIPILISQKEEIELK